MRVFKTREFIRFARKARVTDASLCEAAKRAEDGLIDADLGRGLIKQRIARAGQGKSGGFRTLLAFRSNLRTVFVYGFAKNERDNIGPDELAFWRSVAASFLAMDEVALGGLVERQDVTEVNCLG